MIHISLFSGIGGFDLAAEWMGWKNYVSCDINEFGNKVREYYWPKAYHHKDIHTLTYETINTELSRRFGSEWRNDDIILTGGFPCQPFSVAGKQLGTEDDRHLWPEMLRVIREVRPSWIVGENVRGLVNWSGGMVFEQVQADLENEGYEVLPFILPACAVNAPHKRDRIWFVAHLHKISGHQLGICKNEDTQQKQKEIRSENRQFVQLAFDGNTFAEQWQRGQEFISESPMVSATHGISDGLDGITFSKWAEQSNEAYGNTVVPQVVFQIFKSIENYGN